MLQQAGIHLPHDQIYKLPSYLLLLPIIPGNDDHHLLRGDFFSFPGN